MGKSLSPLKTGFPLRYNKHRASSNQHLYASSNKFDKRTQTRWFEALASLLLLTFFLCPWKCHKERAPSA